MAGNGVQPNERMVLVADDDPDIREALKLIIEDAGYHVVEAADGAAALRLASERHPDVMFLDMLMPGMDGAEVVTRLRASPETAEIPIVAASGYPDTLLSLPADGEARLYYCPKPFDIDRIQSTIEQAIAEREGRPVDRGEAAEEYPL